MQNAVNHLLLLDQDGYTIQEEPELTIKEAKELGNKWLVSPDYPDAFKYEIRNKNGVAYDKFK